MISKLLGHGANDLFWFILPLVLPALLHRYDLSYSQAGGILTIYLAVTAVFSFLLGKLSDKLSRKTILSYGFILASLGLAASGFAATLPVFLIIISITAIGVGSFHPTMYALLDESYPDNKGKVMGLYEVAGTVAILLMFLINGFLINRVGVRGVLVVTAIPALVMGAVYRFSDVIPSGTAHVEDQDRDNKKVSKKEHFKFILFLASVILRVLSVTAVLNFLPTIFVNFFGYSENSASYATAFFFAGGIGGSLLAARFSDRVNSFAILLVGSILLIPSILILSLDLPTVVYPLAVALFGGFGSGCIINQNLLMTRLGRHLGKGEVFGVLMGLITITSAVSPALFGAVIDIAGFTSALRIFILPLIISIAILIFLLLSDVKTDIDVKVNSSK